MGNWDQIYKDYQKGGEAWATLSEGLIPEFTTLIENADFENKSAFDIGCGTGKYLVYLKAQGFSVAGIDSSETAIEMSREATGQTEDIVEADMHAYDIPTGQYDLIYSISTIHHGTKEQVGRTIKRIYDGLVNGGRILIMLPNLEYAKEWHTFGEEDSEIGDGVYVPNKGPEEGLPHAFFTGKEVDEMFNQFSNVKVKTDEIGRFIITAQK